jgi:rhamnose transport system permease protein
MNVRNIVTSREANLTALTLVLFVAITSQLPQFASLQSLRGLIDDTALLLLLSLGEMLVILTRGIDLSLAANVALTGMIAALFGHAYPEVGMTVVLLLSTALGAALGLTNGLLVWLLRIPSIVVTLGTLAIFRGLVYVVSGGTWVTSNRMSPEFLGWVRASFLGLSTLSWIAILGAVLAAAFLKYSRPGRKIFAAGSNPAAAAYAGIDTGRTQCLAFTLAGAVAGLCGYLWVARYAVAYTEVAQGFELTVIAACVIGGVSIAGGVGTITGVVMGCAFLGIIRNALPLLGISPFWQMAISGVVIIVAATTNAGVQRDARQRILSRTN